MGKIVNQMLVDAIKQEIEDYENIFWRDETENRTYIDGLQFALEKIRAILPLGKFDDQLIDELSFEDRVK